MVRHSVNSSVFSLNTLSVPWSYLAGNIHRAFASYDSLLLFFLVFVLVDWWYIPVVIDHLTGLGKDIGPFLVLIRWATAETEIPFERLLIHLFRQMKRLDGLDTLECLNSFFWRRIRLTSFTGTITSVTSSSFGYEMQNVFICVSATFPFLEIPMIIPLSKCLHEYDGGIWARHTIKFRFESSTEK